MIILTSKIYKQIIKGASILTTGGGLSLLEQLQSMQKIDKFNGSLLALDEFPHDAYLMTAAEAGRSDAPPIEKKRVINGMLSILKKLTNKNICGIYPFEIGQESIIFEAAHYLNLPVADFDTAGCRAVPFFDINIFNLLSIDYSFSPMVITTDQDEIIAVTKPSGVKRSEDILRELTTLSSTGIIFFIGGIIPVASLTKHGLQKNTSFSKALELGIANSLNELEAVLKPRLKLDVKVLGKEVFNVKGFLCQKIYLSDTRNNYLLITLNEAIMLLNDNNEPISIFPDKIIILDKKSLTGISSGNLEKDLVFTILILDPEKEWQNTKDSAVFGSKRFSFLYKFIKSL